MIDLDNYIPLDELHSWSDVLDGFDRIWYDSYEIEGIWFTYSNN